YPAATADQGLPANRVSATRSVMRKRALQNLLPERRYGPERTRAWRRRPAENPTTRHHAHAAPEQLPRARKRTDWPHALPSVYHSQGMYPPVASADQREDGGEDKELAATCELLVTHRRELYRRGISGSACDFPAPSVTSEASRCTRKHHRAFETILRDRGDTEEVVVDDNVLEGVLVDVAHVHAVRPLRFGGQAPVD